MTSPGVFAYPPPMARIPSRSMVSNRFVGVDLPPGVFQQPGRAVAGLIQAVGGAADVVSKHVADAQNIRNQSDVRERLRAMRAAQAGFQRDVLEGNIDPAKWLPEWEKRLANLEVEVEQGGLPPVVIEAVREQFKEFSGSSMIQVSGEALKENRRRAVASWELDYNDAVTGGRYGEAEQLIESASDILDPVQIKAAQMRLDTTEQQSNRELDMELDPVGFITRLEAGEYDEELSPMQKQATLERARGMQSQRENQAVNNIMLAIEAGVITTKEQLEEELGRYTSEVSENRAKAMVRGFGELDALTYEERFAVADQINSSLAAFKKGEISLEEYSRRYTETQTTIMGFGKRRGAGALSSLNSRYDPTYFMGPEGDMNEEEARKRAAEVFTTAETRGKEMIRSRALATVKTKVAGFRDQLREDETKPPSKEVAEFEATERQFSLQFRAAMEDELSDFLTSYANEHEGKVPTFPELEAYLNKVQPGIVARLIKERKAAATNPPSGAPKSAGRSSLPLTPNQERLRRWTMPEPDQTPLDFDPDYPLLPPR